MIRAYDSERLQAAADKAVKDKKEKDHPGELKVPVIIINIIVVYYSLGNINTNYSTNCYVMISTTVNGCRH